MDILDLFKRAEFIEETQRILNDMNKLKVLYINRQFKEMNIFINEIKLKYKVENFVWNLFANNKGNSLNEKFEEYEYFLLSVFAKLICENSDKL